MNADKKSFNRIYLIVLGVLICTILPIWYIGRYDVTSLDDFYFGSMTYQAWKSTHSLSAVIAAAIEQVRFYFYAKQATYSSVFLMAAYPGVWNERMYFLTPFIMSSMIIGSVTALVHVIIYDCMGIRPTHRVGGTARPLCGIVTCLLIFVILQTLPVPLEGIFWYNGSLHYVFMESVMIFEAAMILHGMHSDETRTVAVSIVIASLLGVIVGGGNLVTGLQACILTGLHILGMILAAVSDGREHRFAVRIRHLGIRHYTRSRLKFLIPEIITLVCFIINITAPGNAERQESAIQMNPLKAVILSFYYGINHAVSWLSPMLLVVMVIIALILAKLAVRSERAYMHPLALGVVSICVYAAMFTPTLYAMSEDVPSRIQNIVYIAEVLIFFINLANAAGYIAMCAREEDEDRHPVCAFFELLSGAANTCLRQIICAGCVTVMILFLFAADKNTYTSISALRSIANGEAARYHAQSMERFELYNDEELTDIEIHAYTDDARPYLLFKEDVGNPGEEGYWQNVEISNHYGKDSITVLPQ